MRAASILLLSGLAWLAGCQSDYGTVQRLEREAALARAEHVAAERRLDSLRGEVKAAQFPERCPSPDEAGSCWMSLIWEEVDFSERCPAGDSSATCARYAEISQDIAHARARRDSAERSLAGFSRRAPGGDRFLRAPPRE